MPFPLSSLGKIKADDSYLSLSVVSITSLANTVSKRDANSNLIANQFLAAIASADTAAGTTTLTNSSPPIQYFTGSLAQTVILPDARTLTLGARFRIVNYSTGIITVKDGSGATYDTLNYQNTWLDVILVDNTIQEGVWDYSGSANWVTIGGGTLDNVTIGNAGWNSFAFLVAASMKVGDNGTATAPTVLTLDHYNNSAGTPGANFGVTLEFRAQDTTTGSATIAGSLQARIATVWNVAAHSTRIAQLVFQIYNAAGAVNVMTLSPTTISLGSGIDLVFGTATGTKLGTNATQKLAFFGSTAIVQPANTVALDTLLVNLGLRATGGVALFDNDIKAGVVGKGLYVKEGTNATLGLATLVGGTVTVNTTKVTASSRIFLSHQATGGTLGEVGVSARVAGTSFTITSASGSDTSTIAWMIVEPA